MFVVTASSLWRRELGLPCFTDGEQGGFMYSLGTYSCSKIMLCPPSTVSLGPLPAADLGLPLTICLADDTVLRLACAITRARPPACCCENLTLLLCVPRRWRVTSPSLQWCYKVNLNTDERDWVPFSLDWSFLIPCPFSISGPQSTLSYAKYSFSGMGLGLLFVEKEEKTLPQTTTEVLSLS